MDKLIVDITNKYLFTSDRLGFRNWELSDVDSMFEINSDEKVMEFFPAFPTRNQSVEFIERMSIQFQEKGYCYFAVDKLENAEFIGFIGISNQNFPADFTPCIDIGWRIKVANGIKDLQPKALKNVSNTLRINYN